MGKSFEITIIGAGNVGWHLAKAFENAGHSVPCIFSRELENAEKLCSQLYNATPTDSFDYSDSNSDVFILALVDDALETASTQFSFPPNTIVAHTSGSKNLETISGIAENIGVFYPLQSFKKEGRVDISNIPIILEANDYQAYEVLEILAISLSKKVLKCNSEQRQAIHLAAVFSSNFTNHLLGIAEEILSQKSIPLDLLRPLVEYSIEKGFNMGPVNAQTGPAKRGDFQTMDAHLEQLKGNQEWIELYELFSKEIIRFSDNQRIKDLKNP